MLSTEFHIMPDLSTVIMEDKKCCIVIFIPSLHHCDAVGLNLSSLSNVLEHNWYVFTVGGKLGGRVIVIALHLILQAGAATALVSVGQEVQDEGSTM